MWNTRARRWLGIPAVFLLAGSPAGALALTLGMSLVAGPGVVLGLPIAFAMFYLFGGVQALVTGLVAAAALPPGGRVAARPVLLAGVVLGLLAGALTAVAQDTPPRDPQPEIAWPSRAEMAMAAASSTLTMIVVHVAGALAGLLACRLLETRWARLGARQTAGSLSVVRPAPVSLGVSRQCTPS